MGEYDRISKSWSGIEELPSSLVTLGTHPVFERTPPLVKYIKERDRVSTMPIFATDEEAELLIRQYKRFEGSSVGWDSGNLYWYTVSLRGQPREMKVVAMRLIWYGWLIGRDWQAILAPSPLGKAVLRDWLIKREADGDIEARLLRQRWFSTIEERTEIEAERSREEEKRRLAEVARQARNDCWGQHRARLNAAQYAWESHALKIGRSEINDFEEGIETLRRLTRVLDAEKAWKLEEE